MKSPNLRERVYVYGGIVLLAGGVAAAQGPAQPARPFLTAPRVLPPRVPPQQVRVLTAPRSYDACLVQAPDVDPRFSVVAPAMDPTMLVAAPVAGLYRGTLGARR